MTSVVELAPRPAQQQRPSSDSAGVDLMDLLFVCSYIGDYCVCGQLADVLCDAPQHRHPIAKDRATCSAPICCDCALEIGEDEHLCPTHADDWKRARAEQESHRAALIARGPGVMPADGWIVWGKVAHRVRHPSDTAARCGRSVGTGWRPARTERRCAACSVTVPAPSRDILTP